MEDIKEKRPEGGDHQTEVPNSGKEVINRGKASNSQLHTQGKKLKFDGAVDIATGRSRKETHWRNRETTWSAFLNRISTTQRTHETYSEYMSSKKPRQDEIKDVGGFVGGYVNNGRRKAENITHRQLITLDIDFARDDIWADFTLQYENAAALYSTHKHSVDNNRLRIIIPLDRPVGTDEYVAIARRIADTLGINNFDDTTYEPERLMYWPSTAKDAEYVFEYQDGPWFSADEVLATYKNWQDTSEWPVSDRAGEVIHREFKKQGDPLEKPGVVGAFCRTYNIHEAIEKFLDDEYEATNDENRYTYRRGSTAAGLLVYDDKYSYSHHGTDPTSEKTCNAFDLVRLHLFGLKDEDASPTTNISKLPSYIAMLDFAAKDPAVRKLIGIERLQDAKADFSEALKEDPTSADWLENMDVDGKGKYLCNAHNIQLVLNNDSTIKGKLALNKFEQREFATGDLPWRKVDPRNPYLIDTDDSGLRVYLENTYGITGLQKIKDVQAVHIHNNASHPVREYLNSVNWDKSQRVDTLLIDYLGADGSEYVKAVTRKMLVASVTRIFRPGCKFDYVLVLVGKQGIGKSTLIKKLGKQWYSDSFVTVQGKEAFEQVQGIWLLELAELAGLKKADLEAIKHFISKQEDRYRVAYGKRTENFPRQCVFFGTTNNRDFLQDPTGNRRWWPVDTQEQTPTKDIFKDLSDYEIDQIWAEAVSMYRAGETLYLDKRLEEQANLHQQAHRETDEREGLIKRFLETLLPEDWDKRELYARRTFWGAHDDELGEPGTKTRTQVCVPEIWCELFNRNSSELTKYNTKDLHSIMRNLEGWAENPVKKRMGPKEKGLYGIQRTYVRTISQNTGNKEKVSNVANVANRCHEKINSGNAVCN